MVQKITRIPLREAFKHEALDFTRWLQKNIDVLNDCLDITLSNAEREQAAGDFFVDIVCEDESGSKVIIENQLEKSNHDHLGKVITYLVALEAKTAIWIVSDPRPEHVSAFTWLNESSVASFYLLKLEAVKIGDSEPAPIFTLIVGPNETTKIVRKSNQEFVERHEMQRNFWKKLLAYAQSRTDLHSNISPGNRNWVGVNAGKAGFFYNYIAWRQDSAVELYIDCGDVKENKKIFDDLLENKNKIEEKFGSELEWHRLDNRRACRIRFMVEGTGYRDDESKISELQHVMVDKMIKLEESFRPYI